MAKITVTNQLSALRAVFNKMDEVYYSKTPLTVSKLASAITVDMELPVLSEGVTFNTGEPETTEIKLTTGETWMTRTRKGDSDISLQVDFTSVFFHRCLYRTSHLPPKRETPDQILSSHLLPIRFPI